MLIPATSGDARFLKKLSFSKRSPPEWRCLLWRSSPDVASKKNILIVAGNAAAQNVRAGLLRSHGVEVHCAKDTTEAALLWVPDFYHLVLLDMRRSPKEAMQFWRTIRREHPKQRIFFLVGPPNYLSSTCADEVFVSRASAKNMSSVKVVASA